MARRAARADARMVHRGARPKGRRALMAGGTIERRRDMVGRLADNAACAGMAGGAARGNAGVIEARAGKAHEACMACHAVRRSGDVVRGLGDWRHAIESRTVVARRAAGADARMVHRGAGSEGGRARVAGRAIKRCWDMCGGLGDRCNACESSPIMAARAARGDAGVAESAG